MYWHTVAGKQPHSGRKTFDHYMEGFFMHNVNGTWGQTQDNTTAQSTRVPVHNFASMLDPKVTEQLSLTANMPFVAPHVALMPDAHYGLGSSVGTVFGTKGAVIPTAVGVDIGCGMIGVLTDLTRTDIDAAAADPQRQGNIAEHPVAVRVWVGAYQLLEPPPPEKPGVE